MYETGEFDCRNLICGQQLINAAGTHLALNLGRVIDSTHCGKRKSRMSRFLFLSLACFMCATLRFAACDIAANEVVISELPTSVYSLYADCVLQGYLGACPNLMFIDGKWDCKQVACAAPRGTSPTHPAVNIGPARNGTHCGPHHVCINQVCIELPEDVELPEEIEKSKRQFKCHRAAPIEFNHREDDFYDTE